MKDLINKITNHVNGKARKRAVRILAGIVAFTTAYSLILPAITIDEETAQDEPGIVLNESEQTEEMANYEAPEEVEEETPEVSQAETPTQTESEETTVEEVKQEEPAETAPEQTVAEETVSTETTPEQTVVEETVSTETTPEQTVVEETPVEEVTESNESAPTQSQSEETVQVETVTAGKAEFESEKDYKITVEYTEEAGFTKEPVLDVKETLKEDEYANLLEKAQKELDDVINQARFFKLTFDAEKKAAGKTTVTYEPEKMNLEEGQKVEILYLDENNEFQIIDEEKIEVKTEEEEEEVKVKEIRFEAEDLENFTLIVVDTYPAQEFEEKTGDVNVKVSAPAGAFPKDTKMEVELVDENQYIDAINNAIDVDKQVKTATAVDIRFIYDGQEIEPKKEIKVSLISDVIKNTEDSQIVHIDDAGDASVVETEDNEENEEPEDSVTFTSDAFSVYIIVETETLETQFITSKGETFDIKVTYTTDAKIPSDAKLEVNEITEDSDQYQDLFDKASDALTKEQDKNVPFARFFDITIKSNGQVVQPSVPVEVSIEFKEAVNAEENAEFNAVHIKGEDVSTVPATAETAEGSTEVESVKFSADSFSVWGVTYTVDFWYGEYSFSIAGESEILVSEILDRLHIEDVAIEDVTEVTFTNEELVKVEQTEDDWKLISLQAFDTEETLTIKTEDKVIEIKVTDAVTNANDENAVIKVVSNGTTKYYTAFADIYGSDGIYNVTTANSYANRDASVVITFLQDYTMTAEDVSWNFTNLRNGYLSIDGDSHTVSVEDGVSNSVFNWKYSGNNTGNNGSFTISNITISGGAGTIIERKGSGALNLSNVVINGGNTSKPLINKTDGGGNTVITDSEINRGNSTGNLITDAGTGYIAVRSSILDGTHTGGNVCDSHILEKTNTGAIFIGNNQDVASENGVTVKGGTTTGNLIQRTTNGLITLTKTTITGASSGMGSLIYNSGSNTVTVQENSKLYRGGSKGSAIENTGTGQLTITNSEISGTRGPEDSSSVSATKSLIKQGTGALTLTDATITNHVATGEAVCAVDASNVTVAGNVKVTGNTVIKDNKANNGNANLYVKGTNILQIPANSSFSGDVGIYSDNYQANKQFGSKGNATSSIYNGVFRNDRNASLTANANGTLIYWTKSDASGKFYIIGTHRTFGANTRINYGSLDEAIEGANNDFTNDTLTIYGMAPESTMFKSSSTSKTLTIKPGNDASGNPIDQITIHRGDISGDMITTRNTITIENVTFDNPLQYAVDGGFVNIKPNATDKNVTFKNVNYSAGKARGSFLDVVKNRNYTVNVTIQNSSINGPTVETDNSLIKKVTPGSITISDSHITRGNDTGNAIWQQSGNFTITNSVVDGNNVAVTGNLIRTGKGTVTITDTEIKGHTATRVGAYAVDATDLAEMVTVAANSKVYISGSTKIIGNTANGEPANLGVNQDERLIITSDLVNDIGISNIDNYSAGLQFGKLDNASHSGIEHLINDFKPNLSAERSGTKLQWESEDDQATYVVKLTDTDGNLLYKANNTLALYNRNQVGGDFDVRNNVFYDINNSNLYTDANCTNRYTGEVYFQLLRDVQMHPGDTGGEGDTGTGNAEGTIKHSVTLTTADTDASDGYSYVGDGTRGTILFTNGRYDSATDTSNRIWIRGGVTVTVKNIIIDGNGRVANDGALFKLPYEGNNGRTYNTLILDDGAILQNGRSNHSDPCGGVYVGRYNELYMKPGAVIQNCAANDNGNGGAVYIGGHAKFYCSGGEIRNCVSSNGGAIESGGGSGDTSGPGYLYFSGSPKIIDNFGNDGERRNVYDPWNNNTMIYADGLNDDAEIGVYVSDDQMNNHGREGMPFGTIKDGHIEYLDSFSNDRDPRLFGDQSVTNADLIVWYYRLEVSAVEDYYIDDELIKTIPVENSEGVYRPNTYPEYEISAFASMYRELMDNYVLNKTAEFDLGELLEYNAYEENPNVTPVVKLKFIQYLQGRRWLYSTDNGVNWYPINGRKLLLHYKRENRDNLKLIKTEDTDNAFTIEGASFKLERSYPDSDSYDIYTLGEDKGLDSGDNGMYTTLSDGSFFMNLPEGYYKLTETSAPEGFEIMENPITFKVTVTDVPDIPENENVSPYTISDCSDNSTYTENSFETWKNKHFIGTLNVTDLRTIPLHVLFQSTPGVYELKDEWRLTNYTTAGVTEGEKEIRSLNPNFANVPDEYVLLKVYSGVQNGNQFNLDTSTDITKLDGTSDGIIINGDSSKTLPRENAIYYIVGEPKQNVKVIKQWVDESITGDDKSNGNKAVTLEIYGVDSGGTRTDEPLYVEENVTSFNVTAEGEDNTPWVKTVYIDNYASYEIVENSITQSNDAESPDEVKNYTVTQSWDNTNLELTVTNERIIIPVKIQKVDDEDSTKKLSGAHFSIKRKSLDNAWTAFDQLDHVTSDGTANGTTEGEFTLNLPSGEYSLVETSSPGGYVILSKETKFTVQEGKLTLNADQDGWAKALDENGDVIAAGTGTPPETKGIRITNHQGTELPSTGGSGTLPYTLGGLILIILSASMYGFRMRRKERRLND